MEKPKILIIDDDEALCESLKDTIELEGYLVETSYSAEDGTRKVESNFYNIILLDMRLPNSHGLEVLDEIKEISPDTEVIIFTAYADMDSVIKAMNQGAFSFLPKPFETPYLITTLKKAREKQRITFENRILYQQTVTEERMWEDTFDTISDLISIHDKDFNIIRCNEAVIKKLNVEYGDIIGNKCHEVFHDRHEPWPGCPFVRCRETLKVETEEEECMGGVFLMTCHPRFDEAGRFNGVVHIARDITEHKRFENRLQESEEQFRSTFDHAGVGIAHITINGYFLKANKNFCDILGHSEDEIVRLLTFQDITHSKDLEIDTNWNNQLLDGKIKIYTLEKRYLKKDGTIIWVNLTISLVRKPDGRPNYFICVAEDITERKKAAVRISRQSTVLNAINEVFREALTCDTEEELANMCLALAEKLTNSQFGLFGEINSDGLFDTIAISNPGWDACKMPGSDATRLIKDMEIRGIDRSAMKEGKPRIVNNPDIHPDRVGTPAGHPVVTSFLGVPLKRAGETIGMIGLGNKESGYDLHDKEAIEALSIAFVEALMSKRAEIALRGSEEKFRAIFDNTFQFIALLKPDGALIEINRGPLDFAGIKRSDVINKPIWEAPWWAHSETLQNLMKKSVREAAKGNFIRFEATYRGHDGILANIDTSLTPVKDNDGNTIYIINEGRDITALKKTEEKIHMLSLAVEQSPASIVITDIDGNIEYVNHKFCELTGYTYREIIGKNPRILKTGEKSHEEYRELWKTITSGCEWKGEFHNKKKSGELYWEYALISPIWDNNGVIKHFLAVKEDITNKKESEEALLESEEKFRIISTAAPDAIIMSDSNNVISYWNKAAQKIFGFTAEEAIGKQLHETIIPVQDHQLFLKGYEGFRRSGKGIVIGKTSEMTAKNKDGTEFPIEISITAVKLKNEWHSIAILRDISERLRIEEKLRISYKMASLGQLTAGVFHEILNPVNIISSHVQLLLMETEKGSRTEEDLKSIQEEIKRIVKISDGLLRFSRKGELETEKVDANNLLEKIISIVENDMKLDNIRFIRNFNDRLPQILANSDELRQVFLNLITNARDAMPEGGTITVSTRTVHSPALAGSSEPGVLQAGEHKGDFVEISFADTGCGIDQKKAEMIFDPFFTTKEEGKGTGLGLSTSYGIIEDHGGVMSVESQVGKGTTFIIDLPTKD